MLFSDIDGTLLHDDLTIGKDTILALTRASKMGVRIAIASGRYRRSLDMLEEKLGLPILKISINGAMIVDGDDVLRDERISRSAYEKTVEYIKGKAPSVIAFAPESYVIDADDHWFSLQTNMLSDEGIRMDLRDGDAVEKALGEWPCKILIKDSSPERTAKNKEALISLIGDDATIVSSGSRNIEILPPGTDKGKALRVISEKLSIPLSKMIAFGDWDNDAGMLSAAGIGCAMANGSEKAKKAASFITRSNNEDGIAYALDKFLFNP